MPHTGGPALTALATGMPRRSCRQWRGTNVVRVLEALGGRRGGNGRVSGLSAAAAAGRLLRRGLGGPGRVGRGWQRRVGGVAPELGPYQHEGAWAKNHCRGCRCDRRAQAKPPGRSKSGNLRDHRAMRSIDSWCRDDRHISICQRPLDDDHVRQPRIGNASRRSRPISDAGVAVIAECDSPA